MYIKALSLFGYNSTTLFVRVLFSLKTKCQPYMFDIFQDISAWLNSYCFIKLNVKRLDYIYCALHFSRYQCHSPYNLTGNQSLPDDFRLRSFTPQIINVILSVWIIGLCVLGRLFFYLADLI